MAAIYGQITVNDLVIARYTADAWRGRVYAVRYFLTFMVSGVAVSMIAMLYGRGGFDLVLGATAVVALGFFVAVLLIAVIANGVEKTAGAAPGAGGVIRSLIPANAGIQRKTSEKKRGPRFRGDERGTQRQAGCLAANAIAISAAPPNTMLMPTRRPSAHTAVSGRPNKMMPARMMSMMPLAASRPSCR